jgi:hypothetical protein
VQVVINRRRVDMLLISYVNELIFFAYKIRKIILKLIYPHFQLTEHGR